METAALLAKKALFRPVGQPNPAPHLAALEAELLADVRGTGVGPAGLGGATTALAVHVEAFATHITSLPVAVNLNCHALRRATKVILG
jgi:fumarate hydratase subunit alpha